MTTSRRAPGRPAAGDALVDEDRVLDAALAYFSEHGYEAVSLRKLSARLEMGHTFVSDRYGSKEALWRAAVRHAVAGATPGVSAALAAEGEDALSRLVGAVRALHRAAAGSAGLASLIDQEARIDSPRLDYLFEVISPLNARLRDMFDEAVAAGVLRPMPWYLFYFLITAPTSLYSQPPLARLLGRPDDARDHELMTNVVLRGLLSDDPR